MGNLKLGKSGEADVYLAPNSANRHLLLTGISGTGKSVKIQDLEMKLAEVGQAVIAMNYHGTHDEGQIFPLFRDAYQKLRLDIDLFNDGIAFDLLTPMRFSDGRIESNEEVVGGVVSAFSMVFKLGIQQRCTLRKAVDYAVKNHLFFESSIDAIKAGLKAENNAVAELVLERLNSLFCRQIFTKAGKQPKAGHINICDMSRFDMQTQQLVTELILSFLWRRAMQVPFCNSGYLYIVLDEVQNLRVDSNSILSTIMKEGRKFHVCVISATQTLVGLSKEQKEIFSQAGTQFLFRQSKDAALQAAKSFNTNRQDAWRKILQNLSIGSCVAVGDFIVNENLWDEPLILTGIEAWENDCMD